MSQFSMGMGGLILVLLALAWRSGLPQKLIDRLKDRPATAQDNANTPPHQLIQEQRWPAPAEVDVNLLALLERHKQEQVRLDKERELIRQFLYENTEPKEQK